MSHQKPDPSSEGIVPRIFSHYAALPLLYDFEQGIEETLSDKIKRQFVMGTQTMIVKWTFKKGAIIPLHFHPNEQISWMTQGSAEVKSQGKTFIVKKGQIIIFPPYVPHEFLILEDAINIDFFAPVRHDWLTESADYLQKIQK